jgi:NAD(P)H dehydrogenase (quinone)
MVNVLVVYYSHSGNTKTMAETIADAAQEEGAVVRLKEVADASNNDLVWADGVVIGSPVYFGLPASQIKKFIDDSVFVRTQLENKVGAAFVSSGHHAGEGNHHYGDAPSVHRARHGRMRRPYLLWGALWRCCYRST